MLKSRPMAIAWVATIILVALVAGLAHLMKFGGVEFSIGVVVGTAVYNIFHRIRYGAWL